MRTLVASLLFAVCALPLFAARFDVVAGDTPVADAEICVAKAPVTGVIASFFASSAFQCALSSEEIPLGAGQWHVVARAGDRFISRSPVVVVAEDLPRGSRTTLHVGPAASLDLGGWPLADGERRFVYVATTGAAIAVGDRGLVPADVTLVPLTVRNGEIVSVEAALSVPAGGGDAVKRAARASGRTHLVVPLAFLTVPETGKDAPTLQATDAKARVHAAAFAARLPKEPRTLLMFYRDVPVGAMKLSLSGNRWKSTDRTVEALDRPVTVIAEPVEARVTSKLVVHWSTPVDLATLRQPLTECASVPDPFHPRGKGEEFAAVLMSCSDPRQPVRDRKAPRCVEVSRQQLPLDQMRGVVAFEDTPAGQYRLTFEYFDLPPLSVTAIVHPRETSELNAEIRYRTFFGTVTRGEKPLHARVFGATTDPHTGRYVAVMTRLPGPYPQHVSPCDGSVPYRFVPFDPPVENMAFDIDLPENKIVIDVADEKTGLPVAGAYVSLAAIKNEKEKSAHFAGRAGQADEEGEVTLSPVATDLTFLVCAGHEDYAQKCADPFKMGDTREKTLQFRLERLVKRYGQVFGAFQDGDVMWFDSAGRPTERVRKFEADGRFTYQKAHGPDEVVVVSSAVTPLYIFRQPALAADQKFDIRIPAARVRTLTVKLSDRWPGEMAFVTVQIGDLTVPVNGLLWHLGHRQRTVSIGLRPGRSTVISDLLETGPLTAILVLPHRGAFDGDFAHAPERSAFPRIPVGERTEVMFEP